MNTKLYISRHTLYMNTILNINVLFKKQLIICDNGSEKVTNKTALKWNYTCLEPFIIIKPNKKNMIQKKY